MARDITKFLLSAQSDDAKVRAVAEGNLRGLQEKNLPSFLLLLSDELCDKPIESRMLAGIILKNSLDAKDAQQWVAIDTSTKIKIKDLLLGTLGSQVPAVRHIASQVIAKIASIEIPRKEWPELIGLLLANTTQQEKPASVKQGSLETLGYICEEISCGGLPQDVVNSVLTAVVRDMCDVDSAVRFAATRALHNTLEFAQANFEKDTERDYIMKVVCETAEAEDSEIRQVAFECLVSIASRYYDMLGPYMESIFKLTEKALKSDSGEDVGVKLQAIEFWSSICEKEMEFQDYKVPQAGDSSPPHFQFIEKALPRLVTMLLGIIKIQDGEWPRGDDGAWNVNVTMAVGTCLALVARTVGDPIGPIVVRFLLQSRPEPDWRSREAAIFAFGSILEGPSVEMLGEAAHEYLPFFLRSLADEMSEVRYTAAWALCRIFQLLHSSAFGPADLEDIVRGLLKSLNNKDKPPVAEKVCGAIYYVFHGLESSLLTSFLPDTLSSLVATADRTDSDGSSSRSFDEISKLRCSAYVALSEVVRCSNLAETSHIVANLLPAMMTNLARTFDLQIISSDDREKQGDLQDVLCGVLKALIQKLGSTEDTKVAILRASDEIMKMLLEVFSCRSSTVHEEPMLAIGALARATGQQFGKYMPVFSKYLEMGLQNFAEYQVCATSVSVVGDICFALDDKVLPYCDGIMTQLIKNLSSSRLHRSVKPLIFSCLRDVALAIGQHFDKYISRALSLMTVQICATNDYADEDMIDYGNLLKSCILKACSGILEVFKMSRPDLMLRHAGQLLDFIEAVGHGQDPHRDDDSVLTSAYELLRQLSVKVASGELPADDEGRTRLLRWCVIKFM